MENVMVLHCKACSSQISKLSDKCIRCGHPNTWVSPEIQKFLKIKDQVITSTKFTFTHDKFTLNCDARGGYPVWYWMLLFFLLVISFALTITVGFVLSLLLTFVAGIYRKRKTLVLDFSKENPVIENTDISFWQPLISSLEINNENNEAVQ